MPQTDLFKQKSSLNSYLLSLGLVCLAGLAAGILHTFLLLPNLSMVFLLAVLASAIACGLKPSILASILSVLIYDFFFVPPRYTLTVANPQDLLALIAFLLTAVITSGLTARLHEEVEKATDRERKTEILYASSRQIAETTGLEEVLHILAEQIWKIFQAEVVLFLPEEGKIHLKARHPSHIRLSQQELAIATWVFQQNHVAGKGTGVLSGSRWYYTPFSTSNGVVGVLGMQLGDAAGELSREQRELLGTMANQAAVAIERERLNDSLQEARLLQESQRLEATLLSCVSHDFRTPLSSILGSATSLMSGDLIQDEKTRNELLSTICEEGEKLNRFVENLLAITRLENGLLQLNRDWTEVEDVIGTAIGRSSKFLKSREVVVDVETGLPMLWLDFVLFEQVLVNLLENSAKYSPPDTPIHLKAWRQNGSILVSVQDEGEQIPASEREKIFERFYRVRTSHRQVAGSGLGLSICRGIVEAHGGKIVANGSSDGKKTAFEITFPAEKTPPVLTEKKTTWAN